MSSNLKNVTFTLPIDIVDKLREFVKEDYIPSLNAGVKEALEEYAKKMEKLKFKQEMERAAKDQMFLNDIADSMSAFEALDNESARRTEEW